MCEPSRDLATQTDVDALKAAYGLVRIRTPDSQKVIGKIPYAALMSRNWSMHNVTVADFYMCRVASQHPCDGSFYTLGTPCKIFYKPEYGTRVYELEDVARDVYLHSEPGHRESIVPYERLHDDTNIGTMPARRVRDTIRHAISELVIHTLVIGVGTLPPACVSDLGVTMPGIETVPNVLAMFAYRTDVVDERAHGCITVCAARAARAAYEYVTADGTARHRIDMACSDIGVGVDVPVPYAYLVRLVSADSETDPPLTDRVCNLMQHGTCTHGGRARVRAGF